MKALSGSQVALTKLRGKVRENPQLFPEVLPVILHHLPSPIPDLEAMHPARRTEIVNLAHNALRTLGTEGQSLLTPQIPLAIEKFWPQIWAWISLLFKTFSKREQLSSTLLSFDEYGETRDEVLHSLSLILYTSTISPRTTVVLGKTPSCLSIAAQLYVVASQNPPFSSSSNETHQDTLLCAGCIFTTMEMYSELSGDRHFIQTLNSQPPQYTAGILRRIIYDILKPKELGLNCRSLELSLIILTNCTANAPFFNRAFVHHRSIYWVCFTMRRLAHKKVHYQREEFPFVIGCLKRCCSYLQATFKQYGHVAVVQALESRLILSLVKSVDYIKADQMIPNPNMPTDLGDQYKELFDTIAGYAMYHSVATVLSKGLYRGEDYLGGTNNTTFKVEYLAFKKIAEERLTILGEWNMHGMNCCTNGRVRVVFLWQP
ncbi:hypothetical protein PQX77_000662 [Marasmius sp. AFHP31]|nr:hypothetical protein PQX77_000662 [Marasmius sp. AFHP31]